MEPGELALSLSPSIAGRFGISVDDLTFLNPLDSSPLWAGQRLHLSKALRGAASVPPPCVGDDC